MIAVAWIFYKGVHETGGRGVINGPSDANNTNVHSLVGSDQPGGLAPAGKGVGCVRTIYSFNQPGQLDAKAHILFNAGVPMHLPTLEFDPNSAGYGTGINSPGSATGAIKEFHDYGKVCKDNGIKYLELVNELVPYPQMPKIYYEPGSHTPGSHNGNWGAQNAQRTKQVADLGITGNNPRYIVHLLNAINVFKQYGVGVVTSGVPSNHNPTGDGEFWDQLDAWSSNDIWTALRNNGGGIGYHPYGGLNAGTTLSTGVLGQVNGIRNYINTYGAAATALPFLMTEYGVGAEIPGGKNPQTLIYQGGDHNSRLQQVGNFLDQSLTNWENHAEALKLITMCWFWLTDSSPGYDGGLGSYAYFGLRYDGAAQSKWSAPTIWKAHVKDAWDAHDAVVSVLPPPSPKPTCTTLAAIPSNISSNAAVIQATVNPKGTATNVVFEWGPTTAYGTSSGSISAGSGNSPVVVQALMGILSPSTLYHFKATATSSAGTAGGGDQTLTSKAATTGGPDVVTGPASAITAKTATLTGTIDPKDLPAKWWFEWGTDPNLVGATETPHRDLGAPPPPPTYTLNVSLPGTGSGRVTSSPAGIDTGASPPVLSHDFNAGTVVTLTEAPTSPDTFTNWSGDASGTGTTTTVTVNAPKSVAATFTAPVTAGPWTLTVTKAGAGSGRVVSSPAGIDTNVGSSPWTHDFADGTVVTLTETTSDTFGGWTGNGSGNPRTVTMSGNRSVTATFNTTSTIVADWYVTPSGSNINAGTSEGNAFATIDRARQAAGPGDKIAVKGGTTYAEAVQIGYDGVTFQGYGATPPIVSGSNSRAACFNFTGGTRSNVKIDGFEMKDIANAGTAGAILGTAGNANCQFTNNIIHDVTGGGLTTSAGIHLERGAAGASHDNLIEGNLIFNIGVSNSVDTGEHMGVYCFAHRANTYRNNTILQVRKEGIRDYIGIQSTFEGNHFFLCWEGMTFNGGGGHLVRNNAFYHNECGLSLKHTSVTTSTSNLTDGGWTGLGYTPASVGYTRVWHNTFWGNLIDLDMGQGYIWDYADVRNNILASSGDCRLRFFGGGQGHFTVDHNFYPNELGTTNFFQDATGFSMGGPFDSTFPLTTSNGAHNDGNQGLPWDTNGSTSNPGFTGNLEDGDPSYSNTLTGANITAPGGLGTQVGANIGPAMKSYKQYTASSASTTAGGTAARLIDGKWKVPNGEYLATAQSGTLTLDLGSSKSQNILTMHTEVSQTDQGIPQQLTIATSPDNSTWTDSGLGTIINVGTRGSSYKYRFASTRSARYVRMVVNSTHGANIRVMELEPGLVT